jgi:hypothetical protein
LAPRRLWLRESVATGSYANSESFKSTVAISPDGNYLIVFSKPGQNRTNSLEGTLRVRDGQVIDTVIKRNTINQTAPTSTRARIVRLDGREMVLHWDLPRGVVSPTNDLVFRKVKE